MKIEEIMQPNVYCATDDMTVRDLYLALLANEITGAPVLDSQDYLVGVVSLTDIARCVAGDVASQSNDYYWPRDGQKREPIEPNAISQELRVSQIMTPCIHKVNLDSSLDEAVELILEEDIHRVIVTHRGHVVGIVTSGDLLRAFRDLLRRYSKASP